MGYAVDGCDGSNGIGNGVADKRPAGENGGGADKSHVERGRGGGARREILCGLLKDGDGGAEERERGGDMVEGAKFARWEQNEDVGAGGKYEGFCMVESRGGKSRK